MRQRFISIATMLVILLFVSVASAAIPGDVSDSKYIKTYVRGTQNVPAYRDASLRTRGNSRGAYNAAVYPTDEIRIYQMNSSVARIGYIAGNSWVTAYISTSAITLNNSSANSQQFTNSVGQGSVFTRPNGTVYSGSAIDRGDYVWKLAEENGYTQVVYPAGSVYKMAWVRTSDYNSRVGNNRTVSNTTNPIVQPVARDVYANISEGWYRLAPENAPSFAMDVASSGGATTNVFQYQNYDTNNQKFYIKPAGSGFYTLRAGHADVYLDVCNGDGRDGANVWVYWGNNSDAQKFAFVSAGNGAYYIVPKVNTRLVVEVTCGGTNNCQNVQLWTRTNVSHHKWKLIRTSAPGINVNWDSLVNKQLADLNSSAYSSKTNPFYPTYKRQCTWYAWGRMLEVNGKAITFNGRSYAKAWANNVTNCSRVDLQDKCVAVTSIGGGGYGHVVFVEHVDGTYVYYTEDNFNSSTNLKVKKETISSFKSRYTTFLK